MSTENNAQYQDENFRYLEEMYGRIHKKGLAYLQKNYDVNDARIALDYMLEVQTELSNVIEEAEQILGGAEMIIDDDDRNRKRYPLEQKGTIGQAVVYLRQEIFDMEDKLEAARILFAPLERLTVYDDEDLSDEQDMVVAWDEDSVPRIKKYDDCLD